MMAPRSPKYIVIIIKYKQHVSPKSLKRTEWKLLKIGDWSLQYIYGIWHSLAGSRKETMRASRIEAWLVRGKTTVGLGSSKESSYNLL